MKLLFITERINNQDDDLAFVIQWIEEFINQGVEVEVICLKKGFFSGSFPVHSLGKEQGFSKFRQLLRFYKFIFTLKYDRVFVHLSPLYFTFGGWWWYLTRKQMYFWYTHYIQDIHVRLAAFYCKRMFAATAQSLPQYEGNPKKTITNHGIRTDFWEPRAGLLDEEGDRYKLLTVHRLMRSKRAELSILALKHLPEEYTLTIYGRPLDEEYYEELKELVEKEGLRDRVIFHGPVPMHELKQVYPRHRIFVNMAMETIDKTMLEAMMCGMYPVTTPANTKAIGLTNAPEGETPEDVAKFILSDEWKSYSRRDLHDHVIDHHGLKALIQKMSSYIKEGK